MAEWRNSAWNAGPARPYAVVIFRQTEIVALVPRGTEQRRGPVAGAGNEERPGRVLLKIAGPAREIGKGACGVRAAESAVTLYFMRRMSTLPPDLLYQNRRINRRAVRKQETFLCS
jgi:hypothetical protein